ncbi:MAG TPA: response regulator [Burkholderiales bacterium]|nr:response regulator [Burkholderiales bacterium]
MAGGKQLGEILVLAEVVYVVDDDEQVRQVLGMLLTSAGLAVELFACGAEFLRDATPAARSCLVLDMRLPDMDGSALQDYLIERGSAMPIIFVTAYGDIPRAVAAVKKGAFDFIQKPFDSGRLIARVRDALEHGAGTPRSDRRLPGLAELSAREREVLELVLAGKPSRQIGEELFISTKTVDFHRARIMQKLNVQSAAQLFRLCLGGPAGAG